MHSKFACHIGLCGKYFCRVCEVKGSDAADAGDVPIVNNTGTPDNSPAPLVAGSDYDSDTPTVPMPPALSTDSQSPPDRTSKGRGQYQEGMTAMFNRVKAFIQVCLCLKFNSHLLIYVSCIAWCSSNTRTYYANFGLISDDCQQDWGKDTITSGPNEYWDQRHHSRILSRKATRFIQASARPSR